MNSPRLLPIVLGFLVAAFALIGCKAEAGEPCKEENDCSGSLMCCKPSSSPAVRGTCEVSCTSRPDAGPRDAEADGAGDDAAMDDAGMDAGMDAGPTDSGPDAVMDDAEPDAIGPADAEADAPGPDAPPADADPDV